MEGDGVERLLRAVVFTDDWPSEGDVLSAFGGTLIGERGRGVLATFENCHNAMLALATANETTALSVGLAFGEVAFERGDVFGEAVIEAARLAAICPAGSAYATDMVVEQLDDVGCAPLGPVELKGIGPTNHHRIDLIEMASFRHGASISERRDVAVLSCDIVASTELLESEGTEAAISVRRAFDRATAGACQGGEVLHVRGDGVVARFSSATGAIRAAVELHRLVADHGLRSDNTPFSLRSGIATGPDPEADALALEAAANPGQILLSDAAQALAFDLDETLVDGALSPRPSPASALPSQLSFDNDLPLVGRAASLATLERCWSSTLGGRPSVAFLTGEAGIGKTRLVSTFARACHAEGALVLFGSCDMELAAPYRPFVEALAAVSLPASETALLDQLRPLFPQPADHSVVDAGTAVEADRSRLFEAVSDTLAGLSGPRPLLLVLDDLHWSSSATALLLRHVVQHPPAGRVMILGTFRDGEVDRDHPLFGVVNDQDVIGRATRLPLEHLAVDDVADLVAAHFDTELGEAELRLASRIHDESGGLPFFTGEVLRHLGGRRGERSRGVIDTDATMLPASVVDAIGQRLGRLDEATCRTLEVAAVAGLVFDLEVVARTIDEPRSTVVGQLEAAQRLALVRESGEAGRFQFDHALVRSALLTRSSATRVAMVHEQIAEALEALPGDHNDALAHHWQHASGPTARQRAVHHLVLAADRDASSLAWEAAKARYEEALELAGDDGVVGEDTVLAIHLARARVMRASGDSDYLVAMRETGRLARAAGRADVIALVAINSTKPGTWFANANEPDEHLVGLCEDALAAPDLDPAVRCRVLSTLATNLAFDGDRPRREAMVDEAVDLARASGDPDLVASALIGWHLAFWDPSTLDDRVEIIDELDRLARRRDNPDQLFLAGFFRASMLLECGRIAEAQEALSALDEHINRTRNFWFRFLVNRMETALAVATCHPDAKALVDKLFEGSFETQADAAGTWGAQLGGLAIQTGTFGSMVDQLAAASERSRGQGVWSCGLAIARLDQGDVEGARDTLDRVKDAPLDFMWLVSQQMIAEAAYRLGDPELSRTMLDRLHPYAGRVGVIASGTLVFTLVSISIGEAAMGAGEVDLAVASLRSAIEQADELGLPFCQVRSRRRLLEALPLDERGGAEWRAERTKAVELADAFGFPSELAALASF